MMPIGGSQKQGASKDIVRKVHQGRDVISLA